MPNSDEKHPTSGSAPVNSAKLITVLGTGSYQATRYRMNGIVSSLVPYAGAALVELLATQGWPVTEIHVLVTDEAREAHFGSFLECAQKLASGPHSSSLRCSPVSIPPGRTEEELWSIFNAVTGCLESTDHLAKGSRSHPGPGAAPQAAGQQSRDREILLDVTHGFRSIPLVAVAALRFATETQDLPPLRILYGAWEARDPDGIAPFFDLTALGQIDRWARAVREFQENRETTPLAALLGERGRELHVQGNDIRSLRRLGHSIRAGLSIEAGLDALQLANSDLPDTIRELAPPAGRLADDLLQTARDLSPTVAPGARRKPAKADVVLDSKELERQVSLIELAASRFELGVAYRMAREWLVNRVLFASDPRYAATWLERDTRVAAERALQIYYVGKDTPDACPVDEGSPETNEKEALCQIFHFRNYLAHGGFTTEKFEPETLKTKFEKAWSKARQMPDEKFNLLPLPPELERRAEDGYQATDSANQEKTHSP